MKKFVGIQFIDTVRIGKRTFAFGIYADAKVGRVPFVGLAEKYPTDKENTTRGRNFAIGRAFENLGSQMQKKEWKHLQHNGKVVESKKLSVAEVTKLKNSPEAVAKRKARAEKRDKANSKAVGTRTKKDTKVSKTV